MADDADLEVAARRIMWGKCLNSGQSCVAPDYILCSPAIQGSLAEHCKNAVKGFFGEVGANEGKAYRMQPVCCGYMSKIAMDYPK